MKNSHVLLVLVGVAIALIPHSAAAVPDWMPGKKLLVARSINSWNSENAGKVLITLERAGVYMVKVPHDTTESCVLVLQGKMTNNSTDTVVAVIFDYILSNKMTHAEVLRARLCITRDVYRTATIEFSKPLIHCRFDEAAQPYVSLYSIKAAVDQLGDNWEWRYEFVAAIPQNIYEEEYGVAYEAMKVNEVLYQVPQP